MYNITASIVAYKDNPQVLQKAVDSFLNTGLNLKLYVIDNSPSDTLKAVCGDNRICYVHNDRNIGFGAAHNMAISHSISGTEYHLVLNPDTSFIKGTLEKLYGFMEDEGDIGIVMPKVCNPDGSLQYLCKFLPSPLDFFLRRFSFSPLKRIFRKRLENYEFRFTGYNRVMDVPYLSGCFMFIRAEALMKAGPFDERFFLHFEDLDLTRRIHMRYRTVYYPDAYIYHSKKSKGNESLKVLSYLASSYVKYFNKWGWCLDRERKEINRKVIKSLRALT